MKNRVPHIIIGVIALLAVAFVTSLFLRNDLALLQPQGSIADQQRDLLVFATILSLIVVVPVFSLVIYISLKYREGNKKSKYTPEWDSNKLIESIWWGIPIAIILVLSVITFKTSHSLDPFKPLQSAEKPLEVQVIALQWRWLFIYPEQDIATINYVQFPEKTPVNFTITADSPMNSFWIPKLGGQIYAMSGMETKLHLMADSVGEYEGSSANISGEGFAGMRFTARSTNTSDFNQWVIQMKNSSSILSQDSYRELAKPNKSADFQSFTVADANMFKNVINRYTKPSDENTYDVGSQSTKETNHAPGH